jgi:hypothetical protein
MKSWIPSCRDRFTTADFEFLSTTLTPEQGEPHLWVLWQDPQALEEMLDLKEVLRALLESPGALAVSPVFYFYVLVRHSFLEAGITDAALADYVAGVLCHRLNTRQGDPLRSLPGGLSYVSDCIAILDSSHGRMKFHVQVEAGNQFLLLTGIFPQFVENRHQHRGAPGLEFYENFASQAFRLAANNRNAPADAPRRLLCDLSEVLHDARCSLNRLAEEFIFLNEG